ncbi:MAG TPA: hypothetical protein EYP90_04575 [Chromatiaceae bacterium]|nr:hypothetical protein [Chromatiaceae bacterium]
MRTLVWMLLFIWLAQSVLAQESTAAHERPKIGLVLSGGGARGAAHVGVLKVIDELHIPVDFIAGTSMGAIIGGLYASGMSAEEIEQALAKVDWADVLRDDTIRSELSFRRKNDDRDFLQNTGIGIRDGEVKLPFGLLQGQKLLLLLKQLTRPVSGIGDFDDLAIPFRAVATDIVTGQAVVIGKGDLALAMRASASIPSIFAAVELDGKLLVDGGVSDNLPVKVVRDMGADLLIVVDISTPLATREQIANAFDVANQLTTILTRSNTETSLQQLTERDIFMVPELGDLATGDFVQSMRAIPMGEKEARSHWHRLVKLSADESRWQAHLQRRQQLRTGNEHPVLAFVRIDNDSAIADEVLSARLGVRAGEVLDEEKLHQGIARLYGMDLFQNVSYRVVEEGGEAGLVLKVREKRWGPGYLDLGMSFYGSWEDNTLSLGVGYTRTAINSLGGEYRLWFKIGDDYSLFAELYQPLSIDQPFFLNPQVELSRRRIGYYEGGQKLAEYRFSQARVALEVGKELGDWGELRAGYQYARDKIDIDVGSTDLDEGKFREGQLFLQLRLDTMDSIHFPTRGQLLRFRYQLFSATLGGDDDFQQLLGHWTGAYSRGKNVLLAHARVGYTLDGNAPVYGYRLLGGFLNLSGYDRYELSGQHVGYGHVGFLRRLNAFSSLVPIYLGGTLEAGNVWQKSSDFGRGWIGSGSLFLGMDTLLGPLYLGVGVAENDHQTAFFYLGAPF